MNTGTSLIKRGFRSLFFRMGKRSLGSICQAAVVLAVVCASATYGYAQSKPYSRRRGAPEGAVARPASAAVFNGSELDYRNIATAKSFDRNGDLTYNPYYAMELHLAPAFRLGSHLGVKLDFLLNREFTRSDVTTKSGEVMLADIFFELTARKLPQIPVLKVKWTPALRLYVPSSKVSQTRTLILGIRPELTLSRKFKVFDGLVFAYVFSVRKDLHESTTAVTEAPIITPAMGSARSLESFSNLGKRNVSVAVTNVFSISLAFKKRFAALLGFAVAHGFLYDLENKDSRISYEPGSDIRVRYHMMYTGELSYAPRRWITLALGFATENEQLALNSTYRAPFFNRYTAIFFDVRVDIPGLASRLLSRGNK